MSLQASAPAAPPPLKLHAAIQHGLVLGRAGDDVIALVGIARGYSEQRDIIRLGRTAIWRCVSTETLIVVVVAAAIALPRNTFIYNEANKSIAGGAT